ncbi:hypothetical protein NDU88_003423 [Pleurodeles waltl]|uniref:Uncharacterized protein n=1 Tax=Pleurodeles waltl TaxID=8319 RepID=A0AAV7NGM1_PLEWA|nr:hypothetical protein NDU88_003423 [Pleurodeles waltl]
MLTRRHDGVVPSKPTPAAPNTESCRPPSTVPLVKSENKPMREVEITVSVRNVESTHFERRRSRRGAATSTELWTSAGLQRHRACEEPRVPAKVTALGAGGVTGFSSGVGTESSEVDFLGFPPAFLSRAQGLDRAPLVRAGVSPETPGAGREKSLLSLRLQTTGGKL